MLKNKSEFQDNQVNQTNLLEICYNFIANKLTFKLGLKTANSIKSIDLKNGLKNSSSQSFRIKL